MGRRKMSAAAPPSRSWSNVGGSVIPELRAKHKTDLQNLTLTKQPLRTLHFFLLAMLQYLKRLATYILSKGGFFFLLIVLLVASGILLVVSDGLHKKHVQEFLNYAKFVSWWVSLGVASSIGLGKFLFFHIQGLLKLETGTCSGLHTFVLYLGPHIALFTIKAVQCGRIDLKIAPYDTIQLKVGPSWLDKKCSEFGPPVYPASAHSVRIPVFDLLPQIQLEAVLWGIGTALGELPPYFISRAARLSGSESKAVQELDAATSKEDGPVASSLNRTKRWLLSHSQHLNFFSILILASVPNPLFDLAGIMCGQFGVPFWEFLFATLIGKAIIKTHIQTLFIVSLCNNQLLYLIEKELIWIFGHVPGFSATLPSVIARLHAAKDKYLSPPAPVSPSSQMGEKQWNFSFTSVWNSIVWLVLLNFFIKIVTSTAQDYLKKQQDTEMELISDSPIQDHSKTN
ncbi:Vacuole membrane protein KMS1 [Zea mays]|uniref:Vacuole membrane protein KMS1 n=1 Tax=Zea mays TaxID=4577 RepID=A0A1D6N9Y5_MAIZE|nr:Vacuole membrane protein KMS1 [Zea mays]ONM37368.1 Vacuole membrane protein KMS1 [Zea mays]